MDQLNYNTLLTRMYQQYNDNPYSTHNYYAQIPFNIHYIIIINVANTMQNNYSNEITTFMKSYLYINQINTKTKLLSFSNEFATITE